MLQTVSTLTNLIRAVAALIVASVVGAASWFGYKAFHAQDEQLAVAEQKLQDSLAKIDSLNRDVAAKQQEIVRLNTVVKLLKVDHRVARLTVLDQQADENNVLHTTIRFSEVDAAGNNVGVPHEFRIQGDVAYVDAWVVKFKDELVEEADPLRGTSICIFRRIFGEHQEPKNGFVLDPVGSRPAAYSHGSEMSDLEREIWSRFWDYANDPVMAEKIGARAAHGEAPSMKLRKGKSYRIDLRASGGLGIEPEREPPADRGNAI